jgi:hypothetical protein
MSEKVPEQRLNNYVIISATRGLSLTSKDKDDENLMLRSIKNKKGMRIGLAKH